MYAGMLITAFAFAEFSTGMLWGRVSDWIGRKPVLILGLMRNSIEHGFIWLRYRTLPTAILARALGEDYSMATWAFYKRLWQN